MMDVTIHEKAYAKLNLSLDVLGKREDGYHEMLMLMQTVSLADDVTVTVTDGQGRVSAATDKAYIPNTEKNLGYKAAMAFLELTGRHGYDVSVDIRKKTPVSAGMGGGSADAAAVIRALDSALGTHLAAEELCRIGEAVGSDVPFCVYGGTALAKGKGTELCRLPDVSGCAFVIIKPRFSVSTPTLFSKLDGVRVKARPDTDGIVRAIREGDWQGMARRSFNIFESVLEKRERDTVERAKNALLSAGAIGASMTGTGSAVFGIYDTEESARAAQRKLSDTYFECYFAVPVGRKSE